MVDLERLNEPLKAFKRIDNEMDAPEDWVTVEEALNAYRDYLADPVAAAANLDGAREVYTDWATRVRTVDREVTAVIKPGRYLVIPLFDKETP